MSNCVRHQIRKVDVSSMYPSIMSMCNLHSLTTSFELNRPWQRIDPIMLSVREYDTGQYTRIGIVPPSALRRLSNSETFVNDPYTDPWLQRETLDRWLDRLVNPEGDTIRFVIDDESLGKTVNIIVDQTWDSPYRQRIREYTEARRRIKEEIKVCRANNDLDRIPKLRSDEYAIKLIMNKMYGYSGLKEAMYSDLSIALVTVTMANIIIRYVIQIARDELGMKPLETDSVTGDTPIWVKDKVTGEIDIVSIASLHGDISEKRRQYKGNLQVLSRNGWADIHYTKAHEVEKDIHRIRISDGVVDVTSDHSLFKLQDGISHECSPKEIELGDHIEICNMPSDTNYVATIPLDEDLAWFYGLYLAEGSVTYQKRKRGTSRQMMISMQDKEALEKAKRICNEKLGPMFKSSNKDSRVEIYDTRKSSATYRLTGFYNAKAYDFFRRNFYEHDSDMKKVPRDILNCNDMNILRAFIQGYEIGDGWTGGYAHNGSRRKLRSYCSSDTVLAAGIRFILNRIGTKTYTSCRRDKLSNRDIRTRVAYSNGIYRNIPTFAVYENSVISCSRQLVYDISTSDGTFVNARGEIVLHNTDGVFFAKPKENAAEYIEKEISKILARKGLESTIKLSTDIYKAIFIRATKNYVCMHPNGRIESHGVAFKSSRHSKMFAHCVDKIAKAVLNNNINGIPYKDSARFAVTLRRELLEDMKKMDLSKFRLSCRINKAPNEYVGNKMEQVLGLRMEEIIGKKLDPGDVVFFYYVGYGNKVPMLEPDLVKPGVSEQEVMQQLDYAYYIDEIDKALLRFGIDYASAPQQSLF